MPKSVIRLSLRPRSKTPYVPGQIFWSLLVVPLALVIVFAMYLAVASVFENIRFGRSADQIVEIVSTSRNYAAREKAFASYEGEDILASLSNAGLVSVNSVSSPMTLVNSWNGKVTALAAHPSIIRIETIVPARNCRRLAIFFAKDVRALDVQLMEARQDGQFLWRRFYDRQTSRAPREEDVEAACSQGNDVSLAFVLGVR